MQNPLKSPMILRQVSRKFRNANSFLNLELILRLILAMVLLCFGRLQSCWHWLMIWKTKVRINVLHCCAFSGESIFVDKTDITREWALLYWISPRVWCACRHHQICHKQIWTSSNLLRPGWCVWMYVWSFTTWHIQHSKRTQACPSRQHPLCKRVYNATITFFFGLCRASKYIILPAWRCPSWYFCFCFVFL